MNLKGFTNLLKHNTSTTTTAKKDKHIDKMHLDQLHYWESKDLGANPTLMFRYMQFITNLYNAYGLDMAKDKIDRKTGRIS